MKFRSISARTPKLLGILCIILCCLLMSTPVFAAGDIKTSENLVNHKIDDVHSLYPVWINSDGTKEAYAVGSAMKASAKEFYTVSTGDHVPYLRCNR